MSQPRRRRLRPYYARKAFVLSLTEALPAELLGTGVTITASCPGPTETEFGSVAGNDATKLFQRNVADAAPVALHAYRAMMVGKVVVPVGQLGIVREGENLGSGGHGCFEISDRLIQAVKFEQGRATDRGCRGVAARRPLKKLDGQ